MCCISRIQQCFYTERRCFMPREEWQKTNTYKESIHSSECFTVVYSNYNTRKRACIGYEKVSLGIFGYAPKSRQKNFFQLFFENPLTTPGVCAIMMASGRHNTNEKRKENITMLTRKELESYGIKMTDEQWNDFCKQMSKIEEQMWEEDHPLDD